MLQEDGHGLHIHGQVHGVAEPHHHQNLDKGVGPKHCPTRAWILSLSLSLPLSLYLYVCICVESAGAVIQPVKEVGRNYCSQNGDMLVRDP